MDRYIGRDAHASSGTLGVVTARGKRVGYHVVETNARWLIEAVRQNPRPAPHLPWGGRAVEVALRDAVGPRAKGCGGALSSEELSLAGPGAHGGAAARVGDAVPFPEQAWVWTADHSTESRTEMLEREDRRKFHHSIPEWQPSDACGGQHIRVGSPGNGIQPGRRERRVRQHERRLRLHPLTRPGAESVRVMQRRFAGEGFPPEYASIGLKARLVGDALSPRTFAAFERLRRVFFEAVQHGPTEVSAEYPGNL